MTCSLKWFQAGLNLHFLMIARFFPWAHPHIWGQIILLITRSPFCRIEIFQQLSSVPAEAKWNLNKPNIDARLRLVYRVNLTSWEEREKVRSQTEKREARDRPWGRLVLHHAVTKVKSRLCMPNCSFRETRGLCFRTRNAKKPYFWT